MSRAAARALSTPALTSSALVSRDISSRAVHIGVGTSRSTLGAYFAQSGHVWFNDWNASRGWRTEAGLPAPERVDDANREVWIDQLLCLDEDGTATSCDDLPRSTIFFSKDFGGTSVQDIRTFLRVHD